MLTMTILSPQLTSVAAFTDNFLFSMLQVVQVIFDRKIITIPISWSMIVKIMIIIIKNFFQSGRLSCLQEVSFQHLPGLSAVIIIVIIIVNIVIIVINVMITFEKIRLAYPSCSPPPPPSPPSPAGDVRLQRKQGRPLQRFLHFSFFYFHTIFSKFTISIDIT